MPKLRYIIIPLLAATTACGSLFAQDKRMRDGKFIVAVGDDMPTFSFTTIDGETLDSDFLRGQITVLHFAASWCPFSKQQIADYQKHIWSRNSDNYNLSVIGFSIDTPSDTVLFRKGIAELGATYPFAFDNGERIYNLFATPKGSATRTIITDTNGKIAFLSHEHTRRSLRKVKKAVARLLKNNKP